MVVFSPAEAERENYEMAYHGHGRGVVVTNDRGKFLERPMTDAEMIARKPAMELSDNIHRIATYAAFAYIKAWEVIAPAVEQGIEHATTLQPIDTAPQDGTWILGWADKDSSPYRVSWGRNQNNELAWCTSFASFVPGYITHWAPLPKLAP